MKRIKFLKSIKSIEFNEEGNIKSMYGLIKTNKQPSTKSVFEFLGIEKVF